MTASVERIKTWANTQKEEDAMFKGHLHLWQTMISHVQELDLSGKTVLDYGCNQGGFLRMLYNLRPFEKGVGVDIAEESLAKAERLNPGLPVSYQPVSTLTAYNDTFDVGFSHEVIYLISDLKEHARLISDCLKPGGVYYAATGCHTENPLWPHWYKTISDYSNIPVPNYSLNDYATAFSECGFNVSLRPFGNTGFVDYTEEDKVYYPRLIDKIIYYNEHKMLFRFKKNG